MCIPTDYNYMKLLQHPPVGVMITISEMVFFTNVRHLIDLQQVIGS